MSGRLNIGPQPVISPAARLDSPGLAIVYLTAAGSHLAFTRPCAARALAASVGRSYVVPDDVKLLTLPALRHRVVLSPAAEIDGRRVDDVLSAIVARVEAPR